MAKTNVRSFRFDDETLQIIEKFEGNNLSDKFDNLVRYCFIKVPEIKGKIVELENEIKSKKEELVKLTDMTVELESMKNNIQYIKNNMSVVHRKTLDLLKKD